MAWPYNPFQMLCLENGFSAPRCAWELVLACERSGIKLELVKGEGWADVLPVTGRPGIVDDDLLGDLRLLYPGVVAILLNTPGDSTDRPF